MPEDGLIRVAALTGGVNVPSARFRVRQYTSLLLAHGVSLVEYPAPLGSYPPTATVTRPFWAVATLASRAPAIIRTHSFDVTLLQRELLSTYASLEAFTGRPRVFDVDDAIWLRRDGHFARRIAQRCNALICGNSYLADWFRQWNSNVHVVPTGVDTERFKPRAHQFRPIIGWTGTSGGFQYLYEIEGALKSLLKNNPDAMLRIVSDRRPRFREIDPDRIDFVRWTEESEVTSIQDIAVGIMPLHDTQWERGKCSYKMLLYLACGIPVVVSPVGMNSEVLALGEAGFAARSESDWEDHLTALIEDEALGKQLGQHGRRIANQHFSLKTLAPKLADILLSVSD